ncbi:MAG: adenylate/guanylate cyclase domain-containing protein [Deltaproteobacteria bacterium]|nr:MAG: adenylate/guanylate cyclase domain-containing protein [Deltaproteobacteria bacterium]
MRLWHKYAFALLVVSLIPLGVATWQIVSHDVDKLGESIRAHQIAAADVALESVRRLVDEAIAGANTVGAALAMDATPEERERVARAQLIGNRVVDNFTVYRPNGALVMEMRARQDEVRHAPPAELDLDSRKIAQAEGHLVGRVVRRADGALLLPIVVPIPKADGSLYAYGRTAIDLSAMSGTVSDLSARHFGGENNLVRIVDEQLNVVASADPAELGTPLAGKGPLSGVESSAAFAAGVALTVEETRDGRELAGVVVGMSDLLWGVIVEEDRDAAYAAVSDSIRTAAIVGGAFALIALLLGFLAARRLARPIVSVSSAAQRVAGGDFTVRVDVPGRDEVGRMGQAFNDMARDLGDYRDQLIEETRVRGDLSRFLSAEVVEHIVAGPGQLKLGGERRKITVMFADVVAFTDLVDKHPPEFVVGLLNELFTIVTEIVFKHGGIVDKFIGDCVMAIWGAPTAHEDDAQRAVRAAEEIQRWLDVGNARWRKQVGHDIELAIGINTGEAVVGNIGSEKRMEYTAIGDVVNVAARLERLARPGQILVTAETMEFVEGEFDGQALGDVDIVGQNKTSTIFLLEE